MSDARTVDGKISTAPDTKESVAFDLMKLISHNEPKSALKDDRDYWLKLYVQCLSATNGYGAKRALQREPD